jgi:hypothetical protein
MNTETDTNGIAPQTANVSCIQQPDDESPNGGAVGRTRLNLSPEKRLLLVEALTRYMEVLQTLNQSPSEPGSVHRN